MRAAVPAAVAALGLLLGGCVSSVMSAAEVRVPLLLGPVPCIGCGAKQRPPAPMPVAHLAGRESAFMLFLPVPPHGFAAGEDSQPGVSPDRLLFGTSCLADLQLSNLRAQAWMFSLPVFFYQVRTSVEAEATQVVVPGASCVAP
jgi:hypothetical protein